MATDFSNLDNPLTEAVAADADKSGAPPVISRLGLFKRLFQVESKAGQTLSIDSDGDQLALETTDETFFETLRTLPSNGMAVGDWAEWEAEVFVDGAVATPAIIVTLYLGTTVLDTATIATAAANDYVILRGRGFQSAATTLRCYKGLGEVKDATLTLSTHAAPADVTTQALSVERDVTVSAESGAGNAGNLVTLKSLRFTVLKNKAA